MTPAQLLLSMLAAATLLSKPRRPMRSSNQRPDDPRIVQLILEAADRHNVPRQVALAFAWCESKLNPAAQGDLEWSEKRGGSLYQSLVLHAPKFAHNPARLEPMAWHSYGLFQLLAVYHVGPLEHPRVLLGAAINADRGCAEIRKLLTKSRGDVRAARLAYVGCGYAGSLCSEAIVQATVDKLTAAMQRYASEGQS